MGMAIRKITEPKREMRHKWVQYPHHDESMLDVTILNGNTFQYLSFQLTLDEVKEIAHQYALVTALTN